MSERNQRIRPIRSREIRRVNENLILQILHSRGMATQSEIAAETGLQPSTVFRIFSALAEKGILSESEDSPEDTGRKGRKPSYFRLNPEAGYAVGIDLSGKASSGMLVDYLGRAVCRRHVTFRKGITAEEAIDETIGLIEHIIEASEIDRSRLIGIGMGAPGVVDIKEGIIRKYARFPGMEGQPLRLRLERRFGVPVTLHNNASLIALSEFRFGRARGHDSAAALLIRSGVGGAYIHRGELFVSQGKTAFELGHLPLDGGGVTEDKLSEPALLTGAGLNPGVHSLGDLEKLIGEGNQAAAAVMEEASVTLLKIVSHIALLLNPEAFLIITRHEGISTYLADHLKADIARIPGSERFNVASIIPLEYDPSIACTGAADLAFDADFRRT